MKSEDISKAMNALDENTINDAAQKRKASKNSRRPLWITIAAAAACLAAAGGIFAANFGKDSPLSVSAAAVVAAEYPQMAKYPNEEDFYKNGELDWDAYDAARNEWSKSRAKMHEHQPNGYADNSIDYYKKSAKEYLTGCEGNGAFSPLSLYMALSMLAETTDGNSRAQILELLNADSIESLRTQAQQVWQASYADDGATSSLLANSIWLSDIIDYNRPTLQTIAEYHYASSFSGQMGSAEYNKLLRDWLNENTGGLLTEQANNVEMLPETVLALASTVYFKARWQDEFNKNLTEQAAFHAPDGDVDADFMHIALDQTVYGGDNYMMTELRFANNEGSMWLVLPDEGCSPDDLLAECEFIDMLNNDRRNQAVKNKEAVFAKVKIALPKFDALSDIDLTEGLANMGITDVMGKNADFSPLTENSSGITLGSAEQATRVKIDEEGCEAASFTVMMAVGCTPIENEPIDFTLDRPFIFVITNSCDQPTFVGVINNPAQ